MLQNSDPTATGEWWERVLEWIEPAVDFAEDRILEPVDKFVTPRIEHCDVLFAHRRVSTTRHMLEQRALRARPWRHAQRARLLAAWAGAETAAAATRRDLHDAAHNATLTDGGGCCAPLIQLHTDRAEVIRALAVVEDQAAVLLPGRTPNLGAMPGRVRRLAGDSLKELACTWSVNEQQAIAEQAIDRLRPELGAAVKPAWELHIEQHWR